MSSTFSPPVLSPSDANAAFVATGAQVLSLSDTGKAWSGDATGATDSAAAMQAAINALPNGGEILIPKGTWLWSSAVPSIPPALPARLSIRVQRGATVKLTTGAKRFLDPGKVADHDIFQHIYIGGGGTIDVNNVGGYNHDIFGCSAGNSTVLSRIGFSDVVIEDLRVVNSPVDLTLATANRQAVNLLPTHPGTNEATQDQVVGIRIRRLRLEGGPECGIWIGGQDNSGGHSANIYTDDVVVEDIYHVVGTGAQTTSSGGNSVTVQIGGDGIGGSNIHVRNIRSLYSNDDCVEINNVDGAVVENVYALDARWAAFYVKNFRAPAHPNAQRIVFRNCVAEVSGALGAVTAATARGWGLNGGSTFTVGEVVLENCTWYRRGASIQDNTSGLGGEALDATGGPVRRLGIRGLSLAIEGATAAPVSNITTWLLNLGPDTTSVPFVADISNVRVYLALTQGGGASTKNTGIALMSDNNGQGSTYLVRDVTLHTAMTGRTFSMSSGFMAANKANVRLQRFMLTASNDNSSTLIQTHSTWTGRSFVVEDSDLFVQGSGTGITFGSAAHGAKMRLVRHVWPQNNVPAPAAITVSASPFVYTNQDGYEQRVIVTGGTVSAVEVSQDGTTYTDVGATAGGTLVRSGEKVRVTYSVAPTMTKVPPASGS